MTCEDGKIPSERFIISKREGAEAIVRYPSPLSGVATPYLTSVIEITLSCCAIANRNRKRPAFGTYNITSFRMDITPSENDSACTATFSAFYRHNIDAMVLHFNIRQELLLLGKPVILKKKSQLLPQLRLIGCW